MTLSATSTIEKTVENQEKHHPLKNKTFFGIPRHVALIPGLTDRLFRLMAVLCSAYGDDGHIEFKIRTLAALLQKSERQTKDLIDEARGKELISTKATGRSLIFFLGEVCFKGGPKIVRKPAPQKCGNPHSSYPLEKKPEKEKEISNQPSLSGADLVRFLLPPEERKTMPDKLINLVGFYIPNKEIPKLILNAFEKSDPSGYLFGAVNKKQNGDNNKRQSLTKPTSEKNPPPNPQKSLAFKEQEKYNQELKEYRYQDMFMQQGQRQEPRKEPSQAARRLMERMKNSSILKSI